RAAAGRSSCVSRHCRTTVGCRRTGVIGDRVVTGAGGSTGSSVVGGPAGIGGGGGRSSGRAGRLIRVVGSAGRGRLAATWRAGACAAPTGVPAFRLFMLWPPVGIRFDVLVFGVGRAGSGAADVPPAAVGARPPAG